MEELRAKIEIIYRYDPRFVPEFSEVETCTQISRLDEIYAKASNRVRQDSRSRESKILNLFKPFLGFVEAYSNDPRMEFLITLILSAVKDKILEHHNMLLALDQRSDSEERLVSLCRQITTLTPEQGKLFFPLFGEYLGILAEERTVFSEILKGET
jgi:hypothetical protein